MGAGFAADAEPSAQEQAFKKLRLKIAEERLSEKDCAELGHVDTTGGKMTVTSVGADGGTKSQRSFENGFEGRRFQMGFRNNATVDLEDLKIECRFFYTEEREWRTGSRKTEEEIKYMDCILSSTVGAGGKISLQTDPFVMQSYEYPSGVYNSGGKAEVLESSPEGLWVRVTCVMPDGKALTRDFCEPKSLSSRVDWDGKSI